MVRIRCSRVNNPPPVDVLYFVLPYANAIEGTTVGTEVAPNVGYHALVAGARLVFVSAYGLERQAGIHGRGWIFSVPTWDQAPATWRTSNRFSICPRHFEFNQSFSVCDALPAQYSVHPYSTVDVRWGGTFAKYFDFSLIGENLLRPSHDEFGGDPGPLVGIKRSIYGKITWRR